MKRIDWLKRHYRDLLKGFQDKTDAALSVDDFIAADPSKNKQYTSWLIKTYLADGFRSEDLSKAAETLQAFLRHQHRLAKHQRDINRFSTLADVWIAVSPFVEAPVEDLSVSGKEQKRRDKALAYEQSIILVDEDDFKAAVPLTEFASKWWGKGTRWCTAADQNNIFNNYHQKAPLIIFVFPDGRKIQMHVTERTFQLMDENDKSVSEEIILKYWNFIKPFLTWALKRNGVALDRFPKQYRTLDICHKAVKCNGRALEFVPEEHRTLEICSEAVRQNADALCIAPEKYRTLEICIEALKQNGRALEYVPDQHRTLEVCLEAVKKNGKSLEYVPEYLCTLEVCLEAVKQNGRVLRYVPNQLRTLDLCLEAVKRAGWALEYVPAQHRTLEVCLEAVKKSGGVLVAVPDHLRTMEVCLEAVKQNEEALQSVPICFVDEICQKLGYVKQSPAWFRDGAYVDDIKSVIVSQQRRYKAVSGENTSQDCISARM